jgi:hypothetical protein
MPRKCQLAVSTLEQRATPATFSYSAGTLTITAQQGDAIFISPEKFGNDTVPGFVEATTGGNLIFTSATNQPVKNLVVNPGTAIGYGIYIQPDVTLGALSINAPTGSTLFQLAAKSHITGNVKFVGSSLRTGSYVIILDPGSFVGGNALIDLKIGLNKLTVDGEVAGNLTVLGGSGNDTIDIGKSSAAAHVGGNLSVDLKGGQNNFSVAQGTIGRNLKFASGVGNDDMDFAELGDVQIGGSATFAPGNGTNYLLGMGAHTVSVTKNFTYVGGTGNDDVTLYLNDTAMAVGGNVVVSFGNALPGGFNAWGSDKLSVGGTFAASGGTAKDGLYFGETSIGGNMTATLGDGDNTLNISTSMQPAASHIGGGVKFVAGAGRDEVDVCNVTIDRNVTLSLGGSSNISQQVAFGVFVDAPVVVNGNMSITLGSGGCTTQVNRCQIAGNLNVTTGNGFHNIWVNDTDVVGSATIVTGNDTDNVLIDTIDKMNGFPLPGIVHIGGNFTVMTGGGDDLVDMSNLTGQHVVIGGNTKLVGGAGSDTFVYYKTGNVYLGTTTEDFELGENF